ncbi:hypothetical protein GJAV_G00120330 [Gymnothorax javanicus]|nr:hypothetical protein GJAV_G00120330 [Gymnothorax javanicus]
MTLERVLRENPSVTDGGKYTPPDCRAKQKVAIIIPFRHRDNHLKYWLHYLHPILRRQKIDYGIYIINQCLSRITVEAESLKTSQFSCWNGPSQPTPSQCTMLTQNQPVSTFRVAPRAGLIGRFDPGPGVMLRPKARK